MENYRWWCRGEAPRGVPSESDSHFGVEKGLGVKELVPNRTVSPVQMLGHRVARGGYPPPAPTQPCVRFRTRRFTRGTPLFALRAANA